MSIFQGFFIGVRVSVRAVHVFCLLLPVSTIPKAYRFNGLDGYAGFRVGKTYQLTPDVWDDGTVTVEMPHAPSAGRATFTE